MKSFKYPVLQCWAGGTWQHGEVMLRGAASSGQPLGSLGMRKALQEPQYDPSNPNFKAVSMPVIPTDM